MKDTRSNREPVAASPTMLHKGMQTQDGKCADTTRPNSAVLLLPNADRALVKPLALCAARCQRTHNESYQKLQRSSGIKHNTAAAKAHKHRVTTIRIQHFLNRAVVFWPGTDRS